MSSSLPCFWYAKSSTDGKNAPRRYTGPRGISPTSNECSTTTPEQFVVGTHRGKLVWRGWKSSWADSSGRGKFGARPEALIDSKLQTEAFPEPRPAGQRLR